MLLSCWLVDGLDETDTRADCHHCEWRTCYRYPDAQVLRDAERKLKRMSKLTHLSTIAIACEHSARLALYTDAAILAVLDHVKVKEEAF